MKAYTAKEADRELKQRTDAIDQWVSDHAYAPDDIVLGDQGLTDRQLVDLHKLLDIVRPGWRRDLFKDKS